MLVLKLVIFGALLGVTLAKVGSRRYRRNEGNENLHKYYRPKYVYKFHGEDSESDEESAPHHVEYKANYKYVLKDSEEEDQQLHAQEEEEKDFHNKHHYSKHYEHKPDKVTFHGYQHNTASQINEGLQQDIDTHVEIKHEHGTSHQSFQMHHFHPAKVFIKKQDLQYLKKPVEVSVTKHAVQISHPPKKSHHEIKVESPKKYQFEDEYEEYVHQYKPKEHKETKPKYITEVSHKNTSPKFSEYYHKASAPKYSEALKKSKAPKYSDYFHKSTPKYEYHLSKEMEVQPKKVVYHEYVEPPSYEKKVEYPKKYEHKEHYKFVKEHSPRVEYHVPQHHKEYEHYQHQHHYTPQKPQKFEHYTTYRGNNDSSEDDETTQYYSAVEDEDSEEEPHDIHIYH